RRRAVLGCLPRGDRAVLLHAARALACAASVVAVGATVTAAMPRRAIGEAADALESVGLPPFFPGEVICVPSASLDLLRTCPRGNRKARKSPDLLARSEGFEPPTPRFEVWCSIQLSYERRGLSNEERA